MDRRSFLIRTGLLIGAAVMEAAVNGCETPQVRRRREGYKNWTAVRNEFLLDRSKIHMTGFLLASHPAPVR